jgi:hypothetical protein
MTREFASSVGLSDEVRDAVAAEPRSKVVFELEELGPIVKLTVVHDGFTPDSTTLSMISNGWPYVLAHLKTLLETGEAMPRADAPASPARPA